MRTAEREACGAGGRATGPYESAREDTEASIEKMAVERRLSVDLKISVAKQRVAQRLRENSFVDVNSPDDATLASFPARSEEDARSPHSSGTCAPPPRSPPSPLCYVACLQFVCELCTQELDVGLTLQHMPWSTKPAQVGPLAAPHARTEKSCCSSRRTSTSA